MSRIEYPLPPGMRQLPEEDLTPASATRARNGARMADALIRNICRKNGWPEPPAKPSTDIIY